MIKIGIDLGTTNSAGVVLIEEKDRRDVILIEPTDGSAGWGRTFPSVVAFKPNGEYLYCGEPAVFWGPTHPKETIYNIKRLIGKGYEQVVKYAKTYLTYDIAEGPNGEAWIEVGGTTYLPEEITAFILKKIKDDAEYRLKEKGYGNINIENATITVPAYFDHNQRRATEEAAKIKEIEKERNKYVVAGFKEVKLIPEPIASVFACMYYRKLAKNDRKVAVFDLGAGTLDLEVVDIEDLDTTGSSPDLFATPISIFGQAELGGTNMDEVVMEWVNSELKKDDSIKQKDLEKIDMYKLKFQSRDAKESFSNPEVLEGSISTGPPLNKNISLKRERFDDLMEPLIEDCREIIRKGFDAISKESEKEIFKKEPLEPPTKSF